MSKLMKISLDVRREGSTHFRSVEAARSLLVRASPAPILKSPCLVEKVGPGVIDVPVFCFPEI